MLKWPKDAVPFLFLEIFHLSSLNILNVDVYACLVHVLCICIDQVFVHRDSQGKASARVALDGTGPRCEVKPITHLVWLDSPELSQPGPAGRNKGELFDADIDIWCFEMLNQHEPTEAFWDRASCASTITRFLQRYRRRNCELFLPACQVLLFWRGWVATACDLSIYQLSLLLSIYHFSISGLLWTLYCQRTSLWSPWPRERLWVLFSSFLIFSHRQGRHPCGVGVPVSLGQVLSASGGLDQLIMQNWSVDNSQRPNKRPVSWHCTEFDEGIGRLVFYMLSSWF